MSEAFNLASVCSLEFVWLSRAGTPIRVYLLGSGRISVPILQHLVTAPEVYLLGVGTQPDRLTGRHRHLAPTALGETAGILGCAIDKPQSVNDPAFLAHLGALDLDVVLVVAYGQLLKSAVLELPRFGCLNVHASLLPRHRGAAPVQAAILAGEQETGVSFMQMERGLDTGPVYAQFRTPVSGAVTAFALEAELADLAAKQIVSCLREICREGLSPMPQPQEGASLARKIKKESGLLDWHRDATGLERQVRAYSPWPGSWFDLPTLKGRRRVTVTAAAVVADVPADQLPGEVVKADLSAWIIACGHHTGFRIDRLKPEGRGEMTAAEFLRGCPVSVGTILDPENKPHH